MFENALCLSYLSRGIAEVHYDEGIGFIRRKGVDKKKRERIGALENGRREEKDNKKGE